MAAVEASPIFDEAVAVQVEHQTDFKIRKGKSILVLVVDETNCVEATKVALTNFKECHLIVARSVVMAAEGGAIWELSRWLDNVTLGGEHLFTKIELIGKMMLCACRFADLLR